MKKKLLSLERIDHFDVAAQLPVVLPGNDDHFRMRSEIAQQLSRFSGSRLVMDQIAEDNQTPGRVFTHQLSEALRDGRHSPHRDQAAGRPLAQFVAEMQICNGEPSLGSVKKSEPTI